MNKAEGNAFTLVDEDQYRLKLTGVAVSTKPDRNGNTYWIWKWEIVSGQQTGDKFKGKPLRCNTGFTEDQAWFPKMIFDAFGAKPNVDTDTLLGKEVLALVGQREIGAGTRKGQITNDITAFMSPDQAAEEDDDLFDEAKPDGKEEDDDPDF